MSHESFSSCIEECNRCSEACDYCAASCLAMPDANAMARCIALDVDCAEICRLASGYMGRGSELSAAICQVCADVCDACAEECEKHPTEHCKRCAERCRACAQECRRMASGKPARQKAGAGLAAH